MFEVQGSAGALLVVRDFNYECHQGCDIRNVQPTGKSVSALPEGWVVASCLSCRKMEA